jgi:hypothetical protein
MEWIIEKQISMDSTLEKFKIQSEIIKQIEVLAKQLDRKLLHEESIRLFEIQITINSDEKKEVGV